jgi:hypothetical protein
MTPLRFGLSLMSVGFALVMAIPFVPLLVH